MIRALLDTHVLVWWRAEPERLSGTYRSDLLRWEKASDQIAISDVTLWELANLVAKNRVLVPRPVDLWLEELESDPMVAVFPINAKIATEAARLGAGFHKDPADRLIVATALVHGISLMTADGRIRQWGQVPIL
jgi:PIN domain nuclease of toxin-antitoxin system